MDLIVKALKSNPKLRTSILLSEFSVAKSTFYRNLTRSYEIDKDEQDFELISFVFQQRKRKVGIRQIKMILERDYSVVMNKKKIYRIMKKYKLKTEIRRKNKYRYFFKKNQEHKTVKNILNREFEVKTPDTVYSTDITELKYGTKKAYLAVFKDLYSKDIIAKNISNRIDINLTNIALDKALRRLTKEEKKNLMIHSDQGFHFTHFSFRKKLQDNGVTQSMSRKGNCIDNAPVESFFGYLKDHLELKECKNLDDVKKEVTREINYYNHRRPQLGLKKMPPSEYRRQLIS